MSLTSDVIVLSSSHISLGNIFFRNARFISVSMISSSASRGWRGKEEAEDLHDFIAHVRKLRVRSFIFEIFGFMWSGDTFCRLTKIVRVVVVTVWRGN
jgi:hypothetical protein